MASQDGFFVPGSITGSYVSNKRTEDSSPSYESQRNQVGLQKQAALQSLSKDYATTIDNAYASYLAATKGIQGAAMGEGFKQAYIQNQQQALVQDVAQANQNLANVRSQLEQQEQNAVNTLQEQYKTEVSNLDRVAQSFADYRTYLQSLSNTKGEKYFTDEQDKLTIEDMYQTLYEAQPQGRDKNNNALWSDINSNEAMSYSQWVNTQLKDTAADANWYNWLMYQGGLQDFMKSTRQRKTEDPVIASQKAQLALEAARAEELKPIISKYTDYKLDTGSKENIRSNYKKYLIDQLDKNDYQYWGEYKKAVEDIDKLIIPDKVINKVLDDKTIDKTNAEELSKAIVDLYNTYTKNNNYLPSPENSKETNVKLVGLYDKSVNSNELKHISHSFDKKNKKYIDTYTWNGNTYENEKIDNSIKDKLVKEFDLTTKWKKGEYNKNSTIIEYNGDLYLIPASTDYQNWYRDIVKLNKK